MRKFIVVPEGCRWSEVEAMKAESAYRGVCCWYNPDKRVAVIDPATGNTLIFTRELDKAGNLVKVKQHI